MYRWTFISPIENTTPDLPTHGTCSQLVCKSHQLSMILKEASFLTSSRQIYRPWILCARSLCIRLMTSRFTMKLAVRQEFRFVSSAIVWWPKLEYMKVGTWKQSEVADSISYLVNVYLTQYLLIWLMLRLDSQLLTSPNLCCVDRVYITSLPDGSWFDGYRNLKA